MHVRCGDVPWAAGAVRDSVGTEGMKGKRQRADWQAGVKVEGQHRGQEGKATGYCWSLSDKDLQLRVMA